MLDLYGTEPIPRLQPVRPPGLRLLPVRLVQLEAEAQDLQVAPPQRRLRVCQRGKSLLIPAVPQTYHFHNVPKRRV